MHIVNSATGTGTNYPIRIVGDPSTGSSTGDRILVNMHARSDFGDLRFTGKDSVTQLDYWLEYQGDTAVFWVEIGQDLSTLACTMFVYYGLSESTTTSNLANTVLEVVDDFEFTDGITNHGWIVVSGSEDSMHTTTEQTKHGSRSLKIHGNTALQQTQKKLSADRYRTLSWFYDDGDAYSFKSYNYVAEDSLFASRINMGYTAGCEADSYCAYYDAGWHCAGVARSVGWHKLEVHFSDDTARSIYFDGTEAFTDIDDAGYCR